MDYQLWKLKIVNIDQNSQLSHSLLKITNSHINPNNFEKMKVRYAVQIFSKTVANVMDTAISTRQLTSNTAKNTANFIRRINDVFDCLNSRRCFDGNPMRYGLSEESNQVIGTIQKAVPWIQSWKVGKNTPYCFEGLIQSINVVLSLWMDMKDTYPILLTSKLNQDPLENLFSQIRQRRGYDLKPSAQHFRLGLQNIMSSSLIKANENTTNCENDEDKEINFFNNEGGEFAPYCVNLNTDNDQAVSPTSHHSDSLLLGEN